MITYPPKFRVKRSAAQGWQVFDVFTYRRNHHLATKVVVTLFFRESGRLTLPKFLNIIQNFFFMVLISSLTFYRFKCPARKQGQERFTNFTPSRVNRASCCARNADFSALQGVFLCSILSTVPTFMGSLLMHSSTGLDLKTSTALWHSTLE